MSLLKELKYNNLSNPNFKGRLIVMCFSIVSYFRTRATNKFKFILVSPIIIIYKFVTDIILGCEIPASTKVGKGLIIHHGRATVLNKKVVLGNNVTLKHNTTIGNKETIDGQDLGSPIIQDNVVIGPNSVILGPITIGKNSIIGAGSVVVKDVEPFSIVAGNPAKLIKKITG